MTPADAAEFGNGDGPVATTTEDCVSVAKDDAAPTVAVAALIPEGMCLVQITGKSKTLFPFDFSIISISLWPEASSWLKMGIDLYKRYFTGGGGEAQEFVQ